MKLLVVDDSRVMRSMVTRTLRAAGYEDVEEAISGAQALAMVRERHFDFILSDWNMPELDGLGLLKALKADGPDVPFGFVTSECTEAMIALALSSGARFIVNKPFTPEGLAAALARALGARAA